MILQGTEAHRPSAQAGTADLWISLSVSLPSSPRESLFHSRENPLLSVSSSHAGHKYLNSASQIPAYPGPLGNRKVVVKLW